MIIQRSSRRQNALTTRLKRHVKSLRLSFMQAWMVFKTHPFFTRVLTSRAAFISLILLAPIFVVALLLAPVTRDVGGYLYDTPLWLSLLTTFPNIGRFILLSTASLGAVTALYLTLSDNWSLFFRWWAWGKAKRHDWGRSVTSHPLMIRARLSQFEEEDGIFISYAPAQLKYGLPKRKLTYADDRHVIVVGGSRGGKGISIIVPNLLHHKGSVIVYDPAGENFALTAAYRQQVLGQKVVVLDPFGITDAPSNTWNPLAEIDFDADPLALDKCYALAESLIERSAKDSYWTQSAQELLAMCCAFVGLRSIEENLHLGQVYALLHSEDLDPLWKAMSHINGCNLSTIISRFGASCLSREGKEFDGVLQTLRTALRFIATESMSNSLSSSDVSLSSLKDGNTTVYIVMPAGAGATYKGWLRLVYNCAFDAMQDTAITKPSVPTLFLMDEFPLLGYMERIKRAAGEAAKFGVKFFICAQDINQLKEIYGEAWESFVGNSGLTIMFANNDLATQTYLSKKLGQEYYTSTSTSSSSQSGSSTSSSQQLRDVARPDQVGRQSSRETGKAYILTPDMKPI